MLTISPLAVGLIGIGLLFLLMFILLMVANNINRRAQDEKIADEARIKLDWWDDYAYWN
jgi:hypothetical protein